MSDRNPKVEVKPVGPREMWHAFCLERDCPWREGPGEKTYMNQRATAHRKEHRARANSVMRWWVVDTKFNRKDSPYYETEPEAREARKGRGNPRRYSVDGGRIPRSELESA